MTLGMLTGDQAARLKQAGLDYYNHNLDTSPEYLSARSSPPGPIRIAWTLSTTCASRHQGLLRRHRRHGRGARRSRRPDRQLGQPASASGKRADQYAGAGRGYAARAPEQLDPIDFIRTIAVARILMPASRCGCRPAART